MLEKWLLRLLPLILTVISPALRELLADFIKQMEANAAKTDNPWDDHFVAILIFMLNIK